MAKKTISARLPEELLKKIDLMTDNRTNFITKACLQLIHDENTVKQHIQDLKDRRDTKLTEKHRIERDIEALRDEIREMEDLLTEIRTLNEVKKQIPETEISMVRQRVRTNKYDSDPKAPNPESVIQHNAERFAEKYSIEVEKVEELLRVHTDV
jgi:DNA gyrase/topoisomerase IV subunit A